MDGREVDDRFSARVSSPRGSWAKVRVLVEEGWVHVIAADAHGAPLVVAEGRVEAATEVGGRLLVDVAGPAGIERWDVAGACGCSSPAKRWATSMLLAVVDSRARAAD